MSLILETNSSSSSVKLNSSNKAACSFMFSNVSSKEETLIGGNSGLFLLPFDLS